MVLRVTQNWDPTVYRFYIVFAACMVGFLGLGTLYLVTKERFWGHGYLAINVVLMSIFLWGAFTVELDLAALKPGIVVGARGWAAGGISRGSCRSCSTFRGRCCC